MKTVLMCSPDYYKVSYSINPWMRPEISVDKQLAKKQWLQLKKNIEDFLGFKVEVIKQRKGFPDMVFSADQGLVIDKTYIQANFAYQQRKKEVIFYRPYLEKQGHKVVQLPQKYIFEGGDFLIWGEKILAGYGFRTKKKSHEQIAPLVKKEIISLELVDPYFFHLDMALFPLDEKTLAYNPGAFSPSSQEVIKKITRRTLRVSRADALNFSLNCLTFQDRIIVNRGTNGLLPELVARKFKVVETDISEFKKAGGGIHCLAFGLN